MPHQHPMRPGTMVVHAGQSPEPTTGAVMPPIFTSSTYAQQSPGVHKGMDYIRAHNPTRFALERMIAALEGAEVPSFEHMSCGGANGAATSPDQDITGGGFAFASGMAAIATALELLDAGDHIVTMDDLYGGTNRLLNRVRARTMGLKIAMADLAKPHALEEAMNGRTKMVWVETPSNPTLKICDLDAIARAARAINPDVILACDNTFATPINQRPFDYGFDIVMHSATKYLGGHSDVLGGLLVARRPDIAQKLRFLQLSVGAVMGPFDAYMTLRGIKTLDVRMQRHNESAARIANFLEEHPRVERVVYPGLESHPAHAIAMKQMRGFGGMITIFLKGDIGAARTFLEKVRVFALAESLGGVESLIEHPAIMTHASVPADQRKALGISDTLVRLSVGVEDCDDLIADLERALG